MKIFYDVKSMNSFSRDIKSQGKSIGLVPTMGALHDGHLSLVKSAKSKSDIVIVSVFVNPTQFGPNEDFNSYPRDFQSDIDKLNALDVDAVFHPSPEEMYPVGYSTYVNVEGELTNKLCGASRPSHFKGVATVVTKLINITLADDAFFGQKDAQQVAVVKRFSSDLNLSANINMLPIVRDSNGLALSSRNAYLSPSEKSSALVLSRSLKIADAKFKSGERNADILKKLVTYELLTEPNAKIDYVELLNYPSLTITNYVVNECLLAIAVFIGKTRLIDNIILNAGD